MGAFDTYLGSRSGIEALGSSSVQEVMDLQKALETGTGIVADGTTGGAALRVQSLEGALTRLQHKKKDCIGWLNLPMGKAKSIAEEYDLLKGYGETGDGFMPEIASPGVVDSEYERKLATVRFMGVTKELSLASTLVQNITPVEALESNNGMLKLLELAEWAIWEGNSAANALSWDGIGKQITTWAAANPEDAGIVIDMRGAPISPEVVEDASLSILERFGAATDLIMPPRVQSDLAKQMYQSGRWTIGHEPAGNRFGFEINKFTTGHGETVGFLPHRLLRYLRPCPTAAAGASYPSTPVVASATSSNADTLLGADTYYYKVVAVGQNGHSAPCSAVTQAVNGAQDAVLTIVNPSDTISFRIYRATDNTNFYLLEQVACASTATTTYTDDGSEIAGTNKAYMLQMDEEEVLVFRRLADMMKLDLATVGTAKRFMILMYGVPIVKNPRKCCLIKNIGTYDNP